MIFNFYLLHHNDIQIHNLFEIYIIKFIEYYDIDKSCEDKINQDQLISQFYF